MDYPRFLETNIYDTRFGEQFLIIGSCLPSLYPDMVTDFENKWKNIFTLCLEQAHYNNFASKLFNILAVDKTRKVGFLTVDGSPHCVQIHYASKFIRRGLKIQTIEYEHYVIRNDGKVFQVSMEAINKSRDFALLGTKVA